MLALRPQTPFPRNNWRDDLLNTFSYALELDDHNALHKPLHYVKNICSQKLTDLEQSPK